MFLWWINPIQNLYYVLLITLGFAFKEESYTDNLTRLHLYQFKSFLLPWWLRGKASTSNAGDLGLIRGSGRSPGEGNGNPLQYSCLENSVGYNTWGRRAGHDWATSLLLSDNPTLLWRGRAWGVASWACCINWNLSNLRMSFNSCPRL